MVFAAKLLDPTMLSVLENGTVVHNERVSFESMRVSTPAQFKSSVTIVLIKLLRCSSSSSGGGGG
jgi:hypothetical protein